MLVHLFSLDDHVILMSIVQSVFFFTKTEYGFDDLLLSKNISAYVYTCVEVYVCMWKSEGVCWHVYVHAWKCVSMGTHTKIVKRSHHFICQIVFPWQVLKAVSS